MLFILSLRRFMVHGSWFMVHGSWFMVHGSWFNSTDDGPITRNYEQ
jgi:hypothetical protein